MAEILTVFGSAQSGKSTFAVNLACGLAQKHNVVILMSAKLHHGHLQIFFNQRIESDEGIFNAINDTTGQPQNMLTQLKRDKNIYLLGVPNDTDSVFYEDISDSKMDALIRKLSVNANYIIIDATDDIYNPMTAAALDYAKRIYCLCRPSLEACLWERSMKSIFLRLGTERMNILNLYDIGLGITEYINETGLKYIAQLPVVPSATVLQNSGTPIYWERDKKSKKYIAAIDQIVEDLLRG